MPKKNKAAELKRTIGRLNGHPGPRLIVVAALHGNEPAGICALERVVRALTDSRTSLCGCFHAVIGNLTALREGARCLDLDLNRAWTPEHVKALRDGKSSRDDEEDEQKELLTLLDEAAGETPVQTTVLDLHTTSADGAPFFFIGPGKEDRSLAKIFPVPQFLHFEDFVPGTFSQFVRTHGLRALSFEAGRHDDPRSIDRAEAVIWLTLEAAGCLRPDAVPDRERHLRLLADAARGLPRLLEVTYRHPVREPESFRMRPGKRHFQGVRAGEPLADDENGVVKAPEDGILLMPLSQGRGLDGFFLGQVREKNFPKRA